MSVKQSSSIGKLSFVNLYSNNFSRLIEFYRDILGLEPLLHNKGNWFGFKTGETIFALEPENNRKAYDFDFNKQNPILLQFNVSSIAELEKITKSLENKGVRIKQKLKEKSYGVITTFVDPDNNVIELLVSS